MTNTTGKGEAVTTGTISVGAIEPVGAFPLKELAPIFLSGLDAAKRSLAPSFLLLITDLQAPDGPMRTRDQRTSPEGQVGLTSSALPIRRKASSTMAFVSIGRLDGNDIVVGDVSVSKFHAYIKSIGGDDVIIDAGSRNGTFVNDVAVPHQRQGEPVRLRSGDSVRFGTVRTTYVSVETLAKLIRELSMPRKG